jgi:predicted 3-demethylubiquinone-9 3-methyltransferase (glyoxalase superfamily)
MQKIVTFLSYNDQAEEAVRLYTSLFKSSRVLATTRYVPAKIGELIGDQDPAKAKRTIEAMLKMVKLDIAALQRAHDGG